MPVPVLYIRMTDEEAAALLGRLDDLVAERKKEARQRGEDTRGIGNSTVALEILKEVLTERHEETVEEVPKGQTRRQGRK